jgi:acetylornithine deacetylase/succinyl-diaminopimelate desuccinylase-like protein
MKLVALFAASFIGAGAAFAQSIDAPLPAKPDLRFTPADRHAEAISLLGASVDFRSVAGDPGLRAYADYLARRFRAAGFARADVDLDLSGAAPTLVVTLQGTTDAPPLLLSGHMDVVEARREDWVRDPFTMTEDANYYFGRGVVDNKFDVSMMAATLIRLKQEGFRPSRDVILVLSGDEETEMKTTEALAARFAGAALLLNGDGGGGTLHEDGAPLAYNLQTSEKTYADFEISFANPGGHSSRPSKENAIYRLARAIGRLAEYDFPVEANETTREYFRVTAVAAPEPLASAMRKFADNSKHKKSITMLRADPEYVGQLGTTCVATLLAGGHALNALPQRASVSVNCRIFPGVDPEAVRQTLIDVIDDETATVTRLDETIASPVSPMREDVLAALRKAIDARYPGLPIAPQMSAGATDSLYFRAAGVDSYGVSGLFMKPSDDFTHGLDERVPKDAIDGALEHWRILITELAK